jgi:hypothetical protein
MGSDVSFFHTLAPGPFTRDVELTGEVCLTSGHDMWAYAGNTADGRPYYSNFNHIFGIGKDVYLYYDANCDGKTGEAHSQYGHPQWMVSQTKPDLTRSIDLDNDGKCMRNNDRDQDNCGSYRTPTPTMTGHPQRGRLWNHGL